MRKKEQSKKHAKRRNICAIRQGETRLPPYVKLRRRRDEFETCWRANVMTSRSIQKLLEAVKHASRRRSVALKSKIYKLKTKFDRLMEQEIIVAAIIV